LPNISTKTDHINRTWSWRVFLKPYAITESPFRKTFWMDSDMFVIRSLDGLFKKIDHGPVFSSETYGGWRYAKGFLEFMPEKIENNNNIHINSGLIGFNLDRDIDCKILSEWKKVIEYVDKSPSLREIPNLGDQDCLLWTVEKLKVENFIMGNIESGIYNHSPNPRVEFKGDNLVQEIKDAYDHRLIYHNKKPHCVHWMGKNKLVNLCKKTIDNIIIE